MPMPMPTTALDPFIVCDAEILGGKPCIRGTRISVELVLECLASGMSRSEFFEAYPHVPADGFDAALRFAARNLRTEVVWDEKRSA
jgi:uncharacterized protein (DUF433 family)